MPPTDPERHAAILELHANRPDVSVESIAVALGVTPQRVSMIASAAGLPDRRRRELSTDETSALLSMYDRGDPIGLIAARMRLSKTRVRAVAKASGRASRKEKQDGTLH